MATFEQIDGKLLWAHGGERLQIEAWGWDSLRVRATMNPAIRDDLPQALLPQADATPAAISIDGEQATIQNGRIGCTVDAAGALVFHEVPGSRELLREQAATFIPQPGRRFKPVGGDLYRVETSFESADGERFYGLGQHQHGRLDQKGCVIDLAQRNMEVNIPFLVSSRGYGFLWNNPAVGRVELGMNRTRWAAEAAWQIDYWVTTGQSPAEIMANYADATGHPPPLPDWAAGFWQCKLRYRSQDELLEVAREYRRRGLPLSVIVIDFFNAPVHGDWRFKADDWPDPSGMVDELEEMDVKVMVSIWPTVSHFSPNFEEMEGRGLFIRTERGVGPLRHFLDYYPEGGRVYLHFYDATHPEARQYLWSKLRTGYYQHGVKVFWLDANEPEFYPEDWDNVRYYAGPGLAVSNIYPLNHAQAIYDGMQDEGETEIISLNRSAWAGSQRYGAAVWSGDVASSFEALQAQVRAGMNIGLSGIPWWTHDIGGFHDGDPADPAFRELLVRWFQFGVFTPIMRLHGWRAPIDTTFSGGPNEVWSFGEEAYGILRCCLLLRERLRPYIMAQMDLAHTHGTPLMRPLFFDFPGEAALSGVEDQFMFGPDVLVAPVLYAGARTREVILPPGVDWVDAWRGTVIPGERVSVEAPLGQIPFFLRVGGGLQRDGLLPEEE